MAVELPHCVIAAVMGFGSGVLVHVLATQLIRESVESGRLSATLGSFMVGAAVFSGANWLLSKHGAEHRNPRNTRLRASAWPLRSGRCLTAFPSR